MRQPFIAAARAGALAAALALAMPAAADPAALAKSAGCTGCHGVDKKVYGQAFHDIAVKYRGDATAPARLAKAVRTGSKGVWGTPVMTPITPKQIADADLASVIDWVLKQ